jgi:SAM-dependent methyltransferase
MSIEILNSQEYRSNIENIITSFFENKQGLEIGGPSPVYFGDNPHYGNTILNIYDRVSSLDGVNYANNTIWTGNIDVTKGNMINEKSIGEQYILEAIDLSKMEKTYDFVISSNVIEHSANPIKFIEQSLKVLKHLGIIVTIAPRKESNFDHLREIVKFEHLLEDYNNNIQEDDLTHYEEIIELHDRRKDSWIQGSFEERSLKNYENRCLHHHVFDLNTLTNIYNFFNIEIIAKIELDSDYIIMGIKK